MAAASGPGVDIMGQVLAELAPCCGNGSGDEGTETQDAIPVLVPSAEIPAGEPRSAGADGAVGKAKAKPKVKKSAGSVKKLTDMGFNEVAAKNALEATNGNLDQATQLLLSAGAEAEPPSSPRTPRAPPRAGAAAPDPLAEKVATLMGMGFQEKDARDALDGCSGNLERAADLLMSR
ncbi:unnamed protein product [Effrenium voratum]|nr:unnamed protein product [Effrenium voratum]